MAPAKISRTGTGMDHHVVFMRRAIELSRRNLRTGHGGPFGAVIVKDGRIVGEGSNRVTSDLDPTAHAEVVAIREACRELGTFDLSGASIYASCEPCPMCLSAIYWSRLDRAFFANTKADAAAIDFDDDLIYREIRKKIGDRRLPMKQLLRDEAIEVFRSWESKPDKIPLLKREPAQSRTSIRTRAVPCSKNSSSFAAR